MSLVLSGHISLVSMSLIIRVNSYLLRKVLITFKTGDKKNIQGNFDKKSNN